MIWENVTFGLLARHKLTRTEAPAQAAAFLAQVGLAESVGALSPAELSGGMQKRVALARAIAAQPDILFFDEPTTGLDHLGAIIDGLIVDCVKRRAPPRSRKSPTASARRIADQVAMIHKGRIIWNGPASALMVGGVIVEQFTHGRREVRSWSGLGGSRSRR